jgi:protein O-GlcNAc transferase
VTDLTFDREQLSLPDNSSRTALAPIMTDYQAVLIQAVADHNAGRTAAAEQGYRTVLAEQPDQADALWLLGLVLDRQGRSAEALPLYDRVISRNPGHLQARLNRGKLHRQQGRAALAIDDLKAVLAQDPTHLEAGFFLGLALRQNGDEQGAARQFAATAVHHPQSPEMHLNHGVSLVSLKDFDAAQASFERALELRPTMVEAVNNLGAMLFQCRKFSEAIAVYRRYQAVIGNHTESLLNLGVVLSGRKEHGRAQAVIRRGLMLQPDHAALWVSLGTSLAAEARLEEALGLFHRGLLCQPGTVDAYIQIADAHQIQGRVGRAVEAVQKAIDLDPRHARAHNSLGNSLLALGRLDQAAEILSKAIALDSNLVEAHNNLAAVRRNQGRISEAEASFRRALEVDPGNVQIHSNLLLTLLYDDSIDDETLFQEHLSWAERHEAPLKRLWKPWTNDRRPQRCLRIGYVSPDLRDHAAAYFVEPLFASHDRSRVEVFAYAEVQRTDAVTERLKGLVDHWRMTVGMSDDAVAEMIRCDGIDILVDLAGHTANNRLLVFARKPAPVQASWLGYAATCGMSSIDYLILDPWVIPQELGQDQYYTERIIRLPSVQRAYTPPAVTADLAPPPLLRNGYVTFGSFNHYVKVTEPVVRAWSRLLLEIPDSRLLILTNTHPDQVKAPYVAAGIEGHRILVRGRQPLSEYFQTFNEVDIALDPFPHTGGTTTFHTCWMGVPLISMAGRRIARRSSLAILGPLGLQELVADDETGYIAIARALAADPERMVTIRRELRDRMKASIFLDPVAIARDFEDVYQRMWLDFLAAST